MTENMAGRGEGLADRLTESIWAISDGQHPDKDTLRNLIRNILAAAPAGTAPHHVTIDYAAKALEAAGKSYSFRDAQVVARTLNGLLALATPSAQAPPATEFGPFTLTVGELLADGIFHRCVESGEFNHALCAKMIDNALAEEKLSNIAATQEPAGSGAQWSCLNFDHACNLRGYCVNKNCTEFGSPRKVGEDGALKADDYRVVPVRLVQRFGANVPGNESDTRWTVCLPNGDYAHLFPEYLLSRPSSVPVGDQKQEEGV